MARVIYLRPDDEKIVDALFEAAHDELRSVNSLALGILEAHLRTAGYLE